MATICRKFSMRKQKQHRQSKVISNPKSVSLGKACHVGQSVDGGASRRYTNPKLLMLILSQQMSI